MKINVVPFLPLNHQKRWRIVQLYIESFVQNYMKQTK